MPSMREAWQRKLLSDTGWPKVLVGPPVQRNAGRFLASTVMPAPSSLPSVLGSEEGAGITVLAKNLPAFRCTGGPTSTFGHPVSESNFRCHASRIDGISVTGGDAGGGIYVNGWAHGLEISNNRVYGN